MSSFKVGDKVSFGRPNGEKTLGTVVKVNAKTLKIRQDEERGQGRIRPAGTIWKVGPNFCTLIDGTGKPAPVAATPATPKRTDAEILRDIAGVYSGLSPENLSCDGEASRAHIRFQRANLHRQLRALFTEIGREVTESETYGDKPYAGEGTPISRRAPRGTVKSSGYKVGDKVAFTDRSGNEIVGLVQRVNIKSISVQPLGGGTRYWRVGPSLLRAA